MTLLARVAYALLLAATIGAFFVAQRLKAAPAVINNFNRVEYFSPNGDGQKDVERISFRLKEADDVTVDIVDADGGRVRRLAAALPARPFDPVRVTWDGRADEGTRAPDGIYKVRITLRRQARSVVTPFPIRLDTTSPTPAVVRTLAGAREAHVVFPGQPVDVVIRGAGRRAVPLFTVMRTDVTPAVKVREFEGRRRSRRANWDGRDQDGRAVPPGTYVIAVTATDRAGNAGTGPPLPPRNGQVEGRPGITVRGLAVQAPVKPVRAGGLVTFRVDARGASYRWSVRRVGEPRPRKRSRDRKTSSLLAFTAPGGESGLYLLEVRSGRWGVKVPFAVQGTDRRPLLVVLPTMTWLGSTPVDDPASPDGIPNTFANGQPVPYPRLSAGDGLPLGLAEDVAPLLVLLDRARVRYDLTTDLALSLGEDPRASDRPGVLFVGSPRWVTRPLARRLRRYVADGGRVALMGPGSLRAGVQIGATRLLRPTPIGPSDALGGRIARARRIAEPLPAFTTLVDDPEPFPLFQGWGGSLAGFGLVEELVSPGGRAEVVASLGQALTPEEITQAEAEERDPRPERPALSLTRQGKGLVIRVGIAGWVRRAADGDADAVQITRNIVDLLRRVNPRPRSTG